MMAWGEDCSMWDDAVDWANLEVHNYTEIPTDKSVMTTWHEDESLADVFWFAYMHGVDMHYTIKLKKILLLDVVPEPREKHIKAIFDHATRSTDDER